MADTEQEFIHGVVDKRRNPKGQQTGNVNTMQSTANYDSVPNLRARLAAVNPGYYTAARLNAFTKNDMVYALQEADDLPGRNTGRA